MSTGVNIPITGTATSLVAATQQANAALTNMGNVASVAGTKTDKALSGASSAASKAAAALGPLGGVLSRISPEAGAAASSVAGLASAGRGLAEAGAAAGVGMGSMLAVLGPVGIAVAALAATYYVLKQDVDAAEAATKKATDTAEAAQKSFEALSSLRMTLSDKALIATGKATKGELELRDEVKKVTEAYGPRIAAQQALVDAAAKEARFAGKGSDKVKALDRERAALEGLNMRQGEALQWAAQGALMDPKVADGKKAVTKATKDNSEALKELAHLQEQADAADAERVAAAHAKVENMLAQVDATNALVAATNRLGETESERVAREGKERDTALRDQIAKDKLAGISTEKLEEARVTNHAYTNEQLKALDAERVKDATEAAEKEAEARKAVALSMVDAISNYAAQAIDAVAAGYDKAYESGVHAAQSLQEQLIAGDAVYTKSQKAELVRRIADQEAHARKAFNIVKAARIASAVVSTAAAVVNALNDGYEAGFPVGLVLGPASAAAAGIAGGAQIAAIAATQPSFHSGKDPDEVQATILKKEAILNTTAASNLGRERIQELNSGQSRSDSGGPPPIVIGHQVFEASLKRQLNSASALREALNQGNIYGHRKNRRLSSV